MSRIQRAAAGAVAFVALALMAAPALAGPECHGGQSFDAWRQSFARRAVSAGVSPQVASEVMSGVRFDPGIVQRDRGQGVFAQSFLQFSDRMVAGYRLSKGAQELRRYAAVFSRVEQRWGVPGAVVTALWGLESDFGANIGNFPTLTALATLAYDCRRPELFETQLVAAMKIVQRGDLTPGEMHGAWAGELGQTQFLPSDYVLHAVDFDGDGKRDLLHSVPDVLASTAADLAGFGWRRGQPWLQEVRVPPNLPWQQADLAIRHPRSYWVRLGVEARSGRLPADGLPAALLLPMGRGGPAFLAYPNFDVFTQWNKSLVYATTAAYFATRLEGAPAVLRGDGGAGGLSVAQTRELQAALARRGVAVGKIDGVLGEQTRAAVRQLQIKYGMPADGYPTPALLARVRGG
ncbi:MAG TPA: lytic murein transglycosylase [Hyphomicrobiales bacterium]|nr:lytic murein transglycosylase [Hyphomicrobiales bacterium]